MAFENPFGTPNIAGAAQFNAEQMSSIPGNMPSEVKAVQAGREKAALTSDVLDVQQKQTDMSDNQKVASALKDVPAKVVDPNDPNRVIDNPNYADQVVARAQAAGMSGKGLLQLKQNLYVAEGDKLKNEASKQQIQENVNKLDDQNAAKIASLMNLYQSHLKPIIDQYDALGKNPTPEQIASLNAQRQASINEVIKEIQDKEHFGVLDKKTGDAQIATFQAQLKQPFNIQTLRDAYQHSSDYTQALDNRDKAAQARLKEAQAAAAGKQIVVGQNTTTANGVTTSTPVFYDVDKGTGTAVDTNVKAAPKPSAGGGTPIDPDQVHTLAKGLVDGTIDPHSIGYRDKSAVLAEAKKIDPKYDETQITAKLSALRGYANGPQGRNVTAIQTAYNHLELLGPLADALDNGDVQKVNKYSQSVAEAIGKAAPTNFDAVKSVALDEVTKAVVGGTGGGQGDREKYEALINKAQSPEQLNGALKEIKGLMQGRVDPLLTNARASGLTEPQIKAYFGDLYKPPSETKESTGSSTAAGTSVSNW